MAQSTDRFPFARRWVAWGTRTDFRSPPLLVATFSFVLTAAYTLRRHALFETHAYDLGIFGQGLRDYSRFRLPESPIRASIAELHGSGYPLLGDHFSPVLALPAPVYRLIPDIRVLLVVQAALVAWSAFVVTRTAVRRLDSRRAGLAIGVAYALSWGLVRMIGFDVHEVAFALPLLCLALEAYLDERWGRCALWASGLLLVKEDLGFTVFCFGLLLLLRRQRRWGGALCVASPIVVALAMFVVVPHFNPTHVYGYLGGEAADGSGAKGFLSQPWLLPRMLVWPANKMATVGFVLLPTAFLAVRSRLVLLAVPTLVLRFVADNPFYWGTKYHYSAVLMPIVFFALIDALGRVRVPAWFPYALTTLAVALASVFGLGELATSTFWTGGPRTGAANAMVALIPAGVRVAAPDELAPHLVDADTVYLVRTGILDDAVPPVDWLVLDDQASGWLDADAEIRQLAPSRGFQKVAAAGGYEVLHRVGGPGTPLR